MRHPVLAILVLITAITASAAQQPAADRARVVDAYGQVQKRVSRTPEQWTAVVTGDLLPPDSAVRTGERSAILLQTPDRHSIRIGSATTLELKEVGKGNSYAFQLIAGEIWSFVNKARKPARFEVDTPTAVLGVRGTVFNIAHDVGSNESTVSVDEGIVSLNQGGVTQAVEKGYEMRVRPNQLRQARAAKHSQATKDMWKVVLRENWAKASSTPKLNRDAEGEVQRFRQREKAENERRNQQEQQQADREKAKREAKEKQRQGKGKTVKAGKAGKAGKARKTPGQE
jgi:hypothetical protein